MIGITVRKFIENQNKKKECNLSKTFVWYAATTQIISGSLLKSFNMKKIFKTNGRPVQDAKPSTITNLKNGGEEIKPGTLHGGEEIKPGTLHGGEEIKPGTLHGGEEIKPGTLHGGEEIKPGTLHGGEEIKPGTLHAGEELKGGTLCASFSPATYRTLDGTGYYQFRYAQVGNHFEIDILNQPSYGGRDTSATVTHRLSSSRGGSKICISSGHEPRDIETVKKISTEWAELTHNYIKTGKTIDKQVRERTSSNGQSNSNGRDFWSWLFG